jgi:hypothetical protein
MFQADVADEQNMRGESLCIFALEIRSLPFNPNVELEVANCVYYTADTAQKIANGLGAYDFNNFDVVANEFEENLMRLQNAMLYPYLKNRTIVRSEEEVYWYNVLIPNEPDLADSIRHKLAQEEIVKVHEHTVVITHVLKELSNITSIDKFQKLMFDLKFELFSLHILDQQVRQR